MKLKVKKDDFKSKFYLQINFQPNLPLQFSKTIFLSLVNILSLLIIVPF
jgi:hypothetical protein